MSAPFSDSSARRRTVIEAVVPAINSGRFAAKCIIDDPVEVAANVFADSHDKVAAALRYRYTGGRRPGKWKEMPLSSEPNDRFVGSFTPDRLGAWEFAIQGWIDRFATLRYAIRKKRDAGVESGLDQLELAALLRRAETNAASNSKALFADTAEVLEQRPDSGEAVNAALDESLVEPYFRYGPRDFVSETKSAFPLWVDRKRARFAAWYELFPRSTSRKPGQHGTFDNLIERLDYVADLGFDIVYLPPIHPIGEVNRKGRNNSLKPTSRDPGSPWAIGSRDGGHTAVHPQLGTLRDFDRVVSEAKQRNLEVALDIAFQCAPDHPWVSEHPQWFHQRPDGSIQYAENPPKKYQDIYPLNFESEQWWSLWQALRDVFLFWMQHGVKIFRVDNPHTKGFRFWEWCIAELRRHDPEVILLAEAFTRPNVAYRLGKIGFSLGYTYFTWRNSAEEMREYVTELASAPAKWQFRPSFWPNTPDILHETLQTGGRAAFIARLILASTLSANYGIYGPAFELQEHTPREAKSEEYLNSEKYELRHWDLTAPHSLAWLLRTMNSIRRQNPALTRNETVRFHETDNPELLCYSKSDYDADKRPTNMVLIVVSFDTVHTQSGWVDVSPRTLDLPDLQTLKLTDELTGDKYSWGDGWNFVMLDPTNLPVHVLSVAIPNPKELQE